MHIERIRFKKKNLGVLSPLETDVLRILWKRDVIRVRDVHKKLGRRVALTSVAVILDRLYKKKIVSRRIEKGRGGMHYIYSAKVGKNDFAESVIDSTVDKLIDAFGPVAVNYFNERFSRRRKR